MFPEFLVTSLPESVICDNPLMTPMSCAADNDKSNEDRQKEEELLQQIHKLVETRDFLVDDVEFERLRCLYGLMTSTFHAGQHRSLMTAVCERRSLTCSWWLRGLSYQECRSCISARCLSFNERCVSVRQWARPNKLPLVEELCKCLLLFRFLCTCDLSESFHFYSDTHVVQNTARCTSYCLFLIFFMQKSQTYLHFKVWCNEWGRIVGHINVSLKPITGITLLLRRYKASLVCAVSRQHAVGTRGGGKVLLFISFILPKLSTNCNLQFLCCTFCF